MRKRKDKAVSLAPPAPIRAWLRDVAAGGAPPSPAFGSRESLWEKLVNEIALNVVPTQDTLRDAVRIAREDRPLPEFVIFAEMTLGEAATLCGWIDENPELAGAALPGILSALALGRVSMSLVAALSLNNITAGVRARGQSRRAARSKGKSIRENNHPPIVEAMREHEQKNKGKKRPLSFNNAAIEVAARLKKPGVNGGSYSPGHVARVSKQHGVRW
jgi:hypothetical protein